MTRDCSLVPSARALAALAGVLVLMSCTTPEYRAEQAICKRTWLDRLAPAYREQLVNRVRYERVPAGPTTCTAVGNVTTCTQGSRLIRIPHVAVVTVDLNKQERDARIAACTRTACVRKYGNAGCERPGT